MSAIQSDHRLKAPTTCVQLRGLWHVFASISVSTRACHARKLGSTPRQRVVLLPPPSTFAFLGVSCVASRSVAIAVTCPVLLRGYGKFLPTRSDYQMMASSPFAFHRYGFADSRARRCISGLCRPLVLMGTWWLQCEMSC